MSDTSLAVISKAKVALMRATTFDEVVKIRNSAKALRIILKDTLDARDRALEAGAIELLAEHKAGTMLNTLKSAKAGDVTEIEAHPELSVTQACKDANVNPEVAKFWQRMAAEAITEEAIAEYVAEVQKDPSLGITLQGFRKFLLGDPMAAPKERKHDFAVMLLNNGTEKALDAFIAEALTVATKAKATNLEMARQGILDGGFIPRSEI